MTIMLHSLSAQRDTLIYVGDPMCSWCYGFGPELDKIKEAFPNTPMEMVMGGLRAGGTETMMELKDFLYDHWMEVQQASGQKFNFTILDKRDLRYNTEPACRAVWVAGQLDPKSKYPFFKATQESFYMNNQLPGEEDTYVSIANKLGLDTESFLKMFRSKESKAEIYSEFELAQKMGIAGFPSLVAKIDGKLFLVTNGYQKADKIITLLRNKGLN